MRFVARLRGIINRIPESCDLKCRICKIKKCCGHCLHGRTFGETDGSLVVVCDLGVVSHKTKFPRNKPIVIQTCKKRVPRDEKHR